MNPIKFLGVALVAVWSGLSIASEQIISCEGIRGETGERIYALDEFSFDGGIKAYTREGKWFPWCDTSYMHNKKFKGGELLSYEYVDVYYDPLMDVAMCSYSYKFEKTKDGDFTVKSVENFDPESMTYQWDWVKTFASGKEEKKKGSVICKKDTAEATKRVDIQGADIQSAVDAYKAKDFSAAFEKALPLAEQGNARAQNLLANIYILGTKDIPKDYEKSWEWNEKAVSQGYAGAMNTRGYLHELGYGVEKDDKKAEAFEWYLKAAELNLPVAMSNVATMYMKGHGVEKNLKKAIDWNKKAIANGRKEAAHNLGWIYENDLEEIDNAIEWYAVAADVGHSGSMHRLGHIYKSRAENAAENYSQVVVNVDKAIDWYRKSEASGNKLAKKSLNDFQFFLADRHPELLLLSYGFLKKQQSFHANSSESISVSGADLTMTQSEFIYSQVTRGRKCWSSEGFGKVYIHCSEKPKREEGGILTERDWVTAVFFKDKPQDAEEIKIGCEVTNSCDLSQDRLKALLQEKIPNLVSRVNEKLGLKMTFFPTEFPGRYSTGFKCADGVQGDVLCIRPINELMLIRQSLGKKISFD